MVTELVMPILFVFGALNFTRPILFVFGALFVCLRSSKTYPARFVRLRVNGGSNKDSLNKGG